MQKKWMYYLSLLALLALRILALNTPAGEWLENRHYHNAAAIVGWLHSNESFGQYVGSWAFVAFIAAVFVFWLTEEDDHNMSMQFLLLPIVYIPFSIVGTTLFTAEFQPSSLWVQPLIILPIGYVYIALWGMAIWLFDKIGIVR